MKSKTGMMGIVFLAFTMVLGASACGPHAARRGADESNSSGAAAAAGTEGGVPLASLGLELVEASAEDAAVPSQEKKVDFSHSSDEAVATDREIVLKNRIHLPDVDHGGKALYLVWDENAFSSPILDAHYEYRTLDSVNRPQGEADRHSASFEEKGRRWFLSLSRLFADRQSEISPLDQNLITLDLELSDGSRKKVILRFLVSPVLPQSLAAPTAATRVTGLDSVQNLARAGYVYADDVFLNPLKRPLSIWVRADGASFDSTTWMNHHFPKGVSLSQSPDWMSDVYSSVGSLAHAKMRVIRKDLRKEYPSATNEWQRIEIAPSETVEIQWLALPAQNGSACFVPMPAPYSVTLCSSGCWSGSESSSTPPGVRMFYDAWNVSGVRLAGQFQRQIRLTEQADDPASGVSLLEMKKPADLAALYGTDSGGGTSPYSCQGVF